MQYLELPIEQVELDYKNPRIQNYLEIYGDKVTAEGIALALMASGSTDPSASYNSLQESIRVNKGIINPIIVNHESSGKYVVIEGNTRVQIYKEFLKKEPDGPWNKILALVHENLPIETIHAIRLQAHLVGPRDWDPFSKAKYLNELSNKEHLPMTTIISYCGGKASEIRKYIDAYNDMEEFYFPYIDEKGYDRDVKEFSKFAEFQNKGVKQAVINHGFSKNDFSKWVAEGKFGIAQDVRKLPAIMNNEKARAAFIEKDISEAMKYIAVTKTDDLSKYTMDQLVVELTARIRNIEFKEVKHLRNDKIYQNQKNNLIDLDNELSELLHDCGEEE